MKQTSTARLPELRAACPAVLGLGLVMTLAGCSALKLPWPATLLWPAEPPQSAPTAANSAATTTASTVAPLASSPAAPAIAGGDTLDEVVASVDGTPITTHDVKVFLASGASNTFAGQPVGSPAMDEAGALKQLITLKMLDDETKKYAAKVDDAHVDAYIRTMEQNNSVSDDQLRAQLQARGLSYDEFRSNVRKQIEVLTMIDREIRQRIVIPEAQIEAYYKAHQNDFAVSTEKYKLAQILLAVPSDAPPAQVEAVRARAESLRQELLRGADFAATARQYSDDDSKDKGGELGSFTPGELNDQVLAAVINLKPGEISQLIRTKYGFHIVRVEQHQRPGITPLAQVKGAIRDQLMTQEAKAKFQDWVDHDLVKQHYVEIMKN